MDETSATADYYETLQISKNADPDTVQRVFRLLAQRFHPDNLQTGDVDRFRQIHEAYEVLSDPERRARYDIRHETLKEERWRFAASAPRDNDVEFEQHLRYLVLEILYNRRRTEANKPGMSTRDLGQLLAQAPEHLEFTMWYLTQKNLAKRNDQSLLAITAEGIDFVEQSAQATLHRKRLTEKSQNQPES